MGKHSSTTLKSSQIKAFKLKLWDSASISIELNETLTSFWNWEDQHGRMLALHCKSYYHIRLTDHIDSAWIQQQEIFRRGIERETNNKRKNEVAEDDDTDEKTTRKGRKLGVVDVSKHVEYINTRKTPAVWNDVTQQLEELKQRAEELRHRVDEL
ncbi:hypothetical protein Tco_1082369 [Tanacetum coccineum]|uniref:Uncharacterized protein n=1 Tax=Tanacetum coccineum TaxID=301880 RepID=A0ABQ5I1G7_9ASTR